jgi:hypothetical protein
VGCHDGRDRVLFVERRPQRRGRFFCGAEPNGGGRAVRKADTPYGTQPRVWAEPLCELDCVRLRFVWLGCGMLGWVR